MKDLLLLLAFLGFTVYGYFIMGKIDKFLEENQKRIRAEKAKEKKPYVIFDANEEYSKIQSEINDFRREHSCTYVVVCDPTQTDHIDIEGLYNTQIT